MLRFVSISGSLSFLLLSSSAFPVLTEKLLSEEFASELNRPHSPICVVKHGDKERIAIHHTKIIGADELHRQGITGKGSKVIVIEGNFDPTHPVYVDNMTKSTLDATTASEGILYDYVFRPYINYYGGAHAAHVTGTVTSVAPNAKIRVIDYAKEAYIPDAQIEIAAERSIVKALRIAAQDHEAKVVNLSQALVHKSLHSKRAISEDAKQAMIQVARSGKIIVMAAGNEGITLGDDVYTRSLVALATSSEMMGRLILVGATGYPQLAERVEAHSDKAGEAKKVFFVAPGDDIDGPDSYNRYTMATGTSMAAPQVTGGFAALMEAFPGLQPEEYIDLFRRSARTQSLNESTLFKSHIYGNGAINMKAAHDLGLQEGMDIKSKAAIQNKPREEVRNTVPKVAAKPGFIEKAKTTVATVGHKIVSVVQSIGTAVKRGISSCFGWGK